VASPTLTVDLGGPFDGLFTDALDTLHKSGTLKLFLTNARHLLGDVVPSLTVLTINDCPGTWFDVTISPPPPEVASITKQSLLGNVINIQVLGSMDGSASIGVLLEKMCFTPELKYTYKLSDSANDTAECSQDKTIPDAPIVPLKPTLEIATPATVNVTCSPTPTGTPTETPTPTPTPTPGVEVLLNPFGSQTISSAPGPYQVVAVDPSLKPESAPADITVTILRQVISQCSGLLFSANITPVISMGHSSTTYGFVAGRDPACNTLPITTTFTVEGASMNGLPLNLGGVPTGQLSLSVTR